MMDANTARVILSSHVEKKTSEIGNAIDILYPTFETYKAIAAEFGRSGSFWNVRHRLFQLPAGIRWKIDVEQISIDQGIEISKLKNEDEQWLLAFSITETQNLTAKECGNVVSLVLKEDKSIQDALSVSAGIRFNKIQSLVLPLGYDIRLTICKRAWTRGQNWEDFAYQLMLQGLEIDPEEVACQLEKLASDLRKTAETKQESNDAEQEDPGNQLEIHEI